jgi:hypothetical protein
MPDGRNIYQNVPPFSFSRPSKIFPSWNFWFKNKPVILFEVYMKPQMHIFRTQSMYIYLEDWAWLSWEQPRYFIMYVPTVGGQAQFKNLVRDICTYYSHLLEQLKYRWTGMCIHIFHIYFNSLSIVGLVCAYIFFIITLTV